MIQKLEVILHFSKRFRFRGVVLLLILFCFTSCLVPGKHVKKETFYIPKGVTGKIYILFNCKDGKPKKWINGRRLYEIPPSGVLKTQFKENTGYILYSDKGIDLEVKKYNKYTQFFYVDENYKPIQQINYSPYYSPEYRKFFKKNQVNISGTSSVFLMGNGKEKFAVSNYYLFYGDSLNQEKGNFIERRLKEWERFENWDTDDIRKDSIK